MSQNLRVLSVEDSEPDAAVLARHLTEAGYVLSTERVETREAMKNSLASGDWDIVLCEYSMPRFNALKALELMKEMDLDIPLIIISRTVGEEAAVEAMRAGATDYLMKDNLIRLVPTIEREISDAAHRRARRRVEDELLASERKYRLLFDKNPVPMWVFDLETLKFLTVNEAAINHYGYSRSEFLEMTIEDIRPASELPRLRQVISEVTDVHRSGTWTHRKQDGTIIQVEIVADVIHFDGRRAEMVLANDITERRRSERALEQTNHKLEATLSELSATTEQLWQASKLATMGELSASIAHELNNPLGTVALRAEALLMGLPPDDPRRRSLEIVLQEVDRMARLVNDLLQFSRRGHRQVSTVDIREEIRNSIEFVDYHLRTRKIEVVLEFAEALPTIQADRQQLRQLFLNLLTNAVDAMPEGGKLMVRALPGCLENAAAVLIEFTDSGEGIAPEDLGKIWEPFFTTKPEGKGTGLGLAICRRIVEESGGTIDIVSEGGVGTTVSMLCPATNREIANKATT